jgi:hypothetical protein
MSGLSTKNVVSQSGGSSKLIEPGNTMATVTKIELDQPVFLVKDDGFYLVLHLEGPDMGPDFEGFFIDKDNESLGRHKGKVGRVKYNKFPYRDGQTKSGIPVFRDADIVKALGNLLREMGDDVWLDAQDGKFNTIEELITALNQAKPYANKPLNFCIGGRQYLKQNGYTANDCYLPKYSKFAVPYESITASPSKLAVYNEADHLELPAPVVGFTGDDDMVVDTPNSSNTGGTEISDFDI